MVSFAVHWFLDEFLPHFVQTLSLVARRILRVISPRVHARACLPFLFLESQEV